MTPPSPVRRDAARSGRLLGSPPLPGDAAAREGSPRDHRPRSGRRSRRARPHIQERRGALRLTRPPRRHRVADGLPAMALLPGPRRMWAAQLSPHSIGRTSTVVFRLVPDPGPVPQIPTGQGPIARWKSRPARHGSSRTPASHCVSPARVDPSVPRPLRAAVVRRRHRSWSGLMSNDGPQE